MNLYEELRSIYKYEDHILIKNISQFLLVDLGLRMDEAGLVCSWIKNVQTKLEESLSELHRFFDKIQERTCELIERVPWTFRHVDI